MKVSRLSVLRTGRLYPQEIPLVLISIGALDNNSAKVRSAGFLNQWKTPVTPSRVAQCTTTCATAPPPPPHLVKWKMHNYGGDIMLYFVPSAIWNTKLWMCKPMSEEHTTLLWHTNQSVKSTLPDKRGIMVHQNKHISCSLFILIQLKLWEIRTFMETLYKQYWKCESTLVQAHLHDSAQLLFLPWEQMPLLSPYQAGLWVLLLHSPSKQSCRSKLKIGSAILCK